MRWNGSHIRLLATSKRFSWEKADEKQLYFFIPKYEIVKRVIISNLQKLCIFSEI